MIKKILDKNNLKNQSIITCVDKGKTAKVSLKTNNESFYLANIDDKKDNINKKCDYVLVKQNEDLWVLIELKGTKISLARKQIESTYEMIKDFCKDKKRYVAISGKIQLPSAEINKLKILLIEKYKFKHIFIKSGEIKLEYKNNEIKENNKIK